MAHQTKHRAALYQWHQLIQEACQYAKVELDPEIQGYLLMTLVRYIEDDELAKDAIQIDLFNETLDADSNHHQALKSRADHSLMLAGLFPAHIDRQFLRISQYIQLGQVSYQQLSRLLYDNDKLIYQKLADHFVMLVDVLHTIRAFNGSPTIPLIQAMELWSDTGSKTAYQTLTLNRQSIPLNETLAEQAYKH